ncbi:MAG: Asp-tRNA(Asn)/Glu-tRNA(Gln) amidotransferase subunit GatA [Myxococcota bacterium]|nr:Asp-tRNA(Asn)/Glu-tRNA(Gln) amidotransferase subunit GatA [Myxococcota bacterium]
MSKLAEQTISEISTLLNSREISSAELTQLSLDRIEKYDPKVGAYLHIDHDGAKKQAQESDTRRASNNSKGPLDGIPIALKDIFLTDDLPTTCASKILENFIAPYDATVVKKLKNAGAVILGKLNMDEFAMGSSNEHSAFKPVHNPWNLDCVAGGSSGGSAASVAAGLCYGALGTDTGGSIRQPSSFNGIVGLKPTYGRISRYGVIAFASSLDQVGPMTKSVRDAAILLNVLAGHDPCDSTSADVEVPDYTDRLDNKLGPIKIGIPKEYFIKELDSEIAAAVQEAIELYKNMGCEIVDISLPHTRYAIATYYLIATAEASSNLARYDGVRYGTRHDPNQGLIEMYNETRGKGFGLEVKRRIMLGTYALSAGYYDAYYAKAQCVRTLIRQDFQKAFEKVDIILTPTSPNVAFKFGEHQADPIQMYLADIFTVSCNLAGLPGISVPCGFNQEGLPMGLQLLGPVWAEDKVLQCANAFERETNYQQRRPHEL